MDIKSNMMKRLVPFLLACIFCLAASAQKITLTFSNISLSEALKQIDQAQNQKHVHFVFDELEDFRVTKKISSESAYDAVREVCSFYPLLISMKGKDIFVECTQKDAAKFIGRVLDENGKPLEFVNVALYSIPDNSFITGSVTNINGDFVILCEKKNVYVKFSYIGYETKKMNVEFSADSKSLNLGDVQLQTVATELGTVEVTASRPIQTLSKSGIVTQVSGSTLSNLGNGFDVLSQLPGVRTDEGIIEVFGKGTPKIYINGRLLIDLSELSRLSSKEILNVEVLFNPGAKYGAETKSVILIKTVKKQGDGISGSFQASGRMAHYFSQSDNVFLNYRKGGIDLFGTFNYDYSHRFQDQQNLTYIKTPSDDYNLNSRINIYPKSNTYLANFGANWQINPRHYIGVKYEYTAMPDSKSDWLTSEYIHQNGDLNEHVDYQTHWNRKDVPTNLINIYYQGSVKAFNISINNDYYSQRKTNRQEITETSNVTGGNQIGSLNRVSSSLFASKGTAEYSFNKNTLEFGYELTTTDRKDVFSNFGENLPSSDDEIKEFSSAGFLSVAVPLNKFELSGGIRYEHTSSNYYQSGQKAIEQCRMYSRWYPNFDFTFPIGKASFTLSYTAKTKRPLYSQLSSSLQYDDRFTFEGGNPLLTFEKIHDFSLAGVYKWLFFSASYIYDKDAIIGVIKPFSEGAPQNVMTYENRSHLSNYSIVLSLSPKIRKWSPRLRLNLLGQSFRQETLSGQRNMNTPLLFYNFYNTLSFGKGLNINADLTGRTRGDMDVVTLKPSWQINLGLSKSLNNWFFQFQATDIFKTARSSMISYGAQMTLDKWNYSDTQALRLMIRYSFNSAMSKYKGKGAGQSERSRL